MTKYIDRLRGANFEKCPPHLLQKLQKDPSYSFCSTHGGRFEKNTTPHARLATLAADLGLDLGELLAWYSDPGDRDALATMPMEQARAIVADYARHRERYQSMVGRAAPCTPGSP